MKIQLTQTDIETAVREFVANQGIKVEGKEMTVDFKMTRGEDGLLCDLDITDIKPETSKTARRTSTVTAVAKEGSVGERIAKQSEPKTTEAPAVTSAAEVIAAAEKAAAEAKEPAQAAGNVEEAASDTDGEPVKEAKTTTSLFG